MVIDLLISFGKVHTYANDVTKLIGAFMYLASFPMSPPSCAHESAFIFY